MGIIPSDPIILLGEENSGIQTYPFIVGNIALCTIRSPDKQTINEDAAAAIAIDQNSGVLVIADGLGGAPQGDKAAQMLIDTLKLSVLQKERGTHSVRENILDGIEQANTSILSMGTGSATTALVAEIDQRYCRIYHAGDSVALVTGQRGRIKYQSIPHSPTGYAIEAGFINEQEALNHEQRHIISNMVGSSQMRLEVGPLVSLSKFDTLLLSSDGVFDNLMTEEIIEIIRCGPLDRCAKLLAQSCQKRMHESDDAVQHKPDDMTFILFRAHA